MSAAMEEGGPVVRGRQSDCWGVETAAEVLETSSLLPGGGQASGFKKTAAGEGGDGGGGGTGGSRVTTRNVNFRGAFMVTFKSFVGAGILGMPYAFKNAGYAGGTIGLVLVAAMCIYTMMLLVRCKYWIKDPKATEFAAARLGSQVANAPPGLRAGLIQDMTLEYPDIAYYAGGGGRRGTARAAYWFVMLNLLLCQLATCIAYFIFLGNSVSSATSEAIPRAAAIFVCFPIALALSMVRDQQQLVPAAFMGNLALIGGIVLIFTSGFLHHWPPGKMEAFNPDIPIFLGIAIFAMEGINQVLSIEDSMSPAAAKKFPFVLGSVMSTITCMLALFGIVCWAFYGAGTQSSIAFNLPIDFGGKVTKLVLCLYILLTYPFQLFPLTRALDNLVR